MVNAFRDCGRGVCNHPGGRVGVVQPQLWVPGESAPYIWRHLCWSSVVIPCSATSFGKQCLQPVGSCTRVAQARQLHHAPVAYLAGGACNGSGACMSDFKSAVCTECTGSSFALFFSQMPFFSLKYLERHFCSRGKQTSIHETALPGKLRGPGYTTKECKLHTGATHLMIKGIRGPSSDKGSLEGVILCRMFEISY